MICCPGEDRWRSLLDDRLDAAERPGLEAHLDGCAACQAMLERLTRYSGPDLRRSDPEPQVSLRSEPGRSTATTWNRTSSPWPTTGPVLPPAAPGLPEVPGYEILSTLGHGGMGVVYKARQHGLDRLVALKMIRGGSHAGEEHLARFRIEAWSVARLRHPHVVQIHDVGEAEGLPFVALELLEGGTLEARIAGTPQPQREAAELLQTLASAIASAHRAGVVHRDLKSSNILFTADGTPKIADFGLAKRIDEEDGQTRTGQVMGSPSFMAPEQANGDARGVGPAADLYSLGAILYELLTGRPPFKGTSPMETLLQVVHDEPVPPSRLRSGLSRDLETICLKCLAKEPARRYADAEALALDLRLHLAGEAIRARPTGPRERAWKWMRRQPAVAALIGLGLVTVSGMVAARWVAEADRDTRAARAERALFAAAPAIATGKLGEAKPHVDLLHELLPALQTDPRRPGLAADAAEAIRLYDAQFAEQVRSRRDRERWATFEIRKDEALFRDAEFRNQAEDLQATRRTCRDALAVFGEEKDGRWTFGPIPASLKPAERAELHRGLHQLLTVLARATLHPLPGEEAAIQTGLALGLLDRAGELVPPNRSLHAFRAECLVRIGDEGGAARERDAAEASGPADPFEDLLAGYEHYHRREWSRAIVRFEASLRADPHPFWPQYLLALCRVRTRQMELARVGLTACLQTHSDHFWIYLHRGFAAAEEGAEMLSASRGRGKVPAESRFESASADYRAARERAHTDEEHFALRINRGILALHRLDLDGAALDFEAAIRLRPGRYEGHVNLADVCRRRKDHAGALARCETAIKIAPRLASLRTLHAGLIEAQADGTGWPARAIEDLSDAIRLEADDRPARAGDLVRRGRLLALEGRHVESLADCDEALTITPNDAPAHLVRVEALLNLRRLDEVIASCDAVLDPARSATDHAFPVRTIADLTQIRGMAHADRRDYPAAIRDFDRVAILRPDDADPLIRRGWAYLVSEAPRLALPDFEKAIRLDPDNGDAWNGRGYARVVLGRVQEGIADAEEAVRRGGATSRTAYNAARIYAQAVGSVVANVADPAQPRRRPSSSQVVDEYQDRAQHLIRQALERLPETQRNAFWKDVIQSDPALAAIRRRAKFSQLAGQLGRQAR